RQRITTESTNSSNLIYRAVVYKAPAQNIGKALIAGRAPIAWQNTPDLTQANNHAVFKPLEHVIAANQDNRFIAYNNIPPDVLKVKTKSNSKGVLMMNPGVADEASWIVHTIPGFPKALTGYVFPPAKTLKGLLFICLTIKESEIDAIGKFICMKKDYILPKTIRKKLPISCKKRILKTNIFRIII
ncbi:conserved hypothetical protein, partial [Trichinella spiralis]|uniref:hypothetical protein n=1 Tax=Trichinella spiralis TaxID=6334 RepID=UPI0001EFD2E1